MIAVMLLLEAFRPDLLLAAVPIGFGGGWSGRSAGVGRQPRLPGALPPPRTEAHPCAGHQHHGHRAHHHRHHATRVCSRATCRDASFSGSAPGRWAAGCCSEGGCPDIPVRSIRARRPVPALVLPGAEAKVVDPCSSYRGYIGIVQCVSGQRAEVLRRWQLG